MQGTDGLVCLEGGIGVAGFGERQLRIHVYPCADQRVLGFDAIEARFQQRDRSQVPACNGGGGGAGRQLIWRRLCWHSGHD